MTVAAINEVYNLTTDAKLRCYVTNDEEHHYEHGLISYGVDIVRSFNELTMQLQNAWDFHKPGSCVSGVSDHHWDCPRVDFGTQSSGMGRCNAAIQEIINRLDYGMCAQHELEVYHPSFTSLPAFFPEVLPEKKCAKKKCFPCAVGVARR